MGSYEEIQNQCEHIRVIENLYDKALSAVLFNGSTELHWASSKGVYSHQLSLNIFLESIMCVALDDCFADDTVVNAEEEEEADVQVYHLNTTITM